MDKPIFQIQVNSGDWVKLGEVDEPFVAEHTPNIDPCQRTSFTTTIAIDESASHRFLPWANSVHEVRQQVQQQIADRIQELIKERLLGSSDDELRQYHFGDFRLEPLKPPVTLNDIQRIGRGLRGGGKACAAWHQLKAENPNMPFTELVKTHQMVFTEIEPVTFVDEEPKVKTIHYRGFTFTDVPEWVNYVTTDYYGDIYGYENKPKFLDVAAVWTNVGGGRDCRLRKALVRGAYAPKNSLVEV